LRSNFFPSMFDVGRSMFDVPKSLPQRHKGR
jgi:hypothetical protein